jgi:SET domain-containing protein
MNKIVVKQISKNHRGVFASSNIKKGEIIEESPVIVIPKKDQKVLDKTYIFNYYFDWGNSDQPAIALGFGSLFNHSYDPNAEYKENVKKRIMIFRSIKDIKKGEEILTNYNGESTDKSPIWFKVKKKF